MGCQDQLDHGQDSPHCTRRKSGGRGVMSRVASSRHHRAARRTEQHRQRVVGPPPDIQAIQWSSTYTAQSYLLSNRSKIISLYPSQLTCSAEEPIPYSANALNVTRVRHSAVGAPAREAHHDAPRLGPIDPRARALPLARSQHLPQITPAACVCASTCACRRAHSACADTHRPHARQRERLAARVGLQAPARSHSLLRDDRHASQGAASQRHGTARAVRG